MQKLNDRRFSNHYQYFVQQRRDTIAYMPQSVEGLKFADELEDLDETITDLNNV